MKSKYPSLAAAGRFCLYLLSLCLLSNPSYGQGEADNWFFGGRTGLSFRTRPVQTVLTGSCCGTANFSYDGAVPTTVSDSLGNLLFYSDGRNVWDRTHTLMPNGGALPLLRTLRINGLIVQAAPWPGRPNRYFVFGCADDTPTFDFDLTVSEIDLTLNSGRGDVLAATNGRTLSHNMDATLTIARHANGRDFWLIAHDFQGSQFRAFAITPAGLSTTPVISSAGLPNISPIVGAIFCRLSPDGRRLCRVSGLTTGGGETLEVMKFNAATGQLSSDYTLTARGVAYGAFGEFSPDSKKYYLASAEEDILAGTTTFYISQFDLSAGSPAAVQASRTDFNVTNVTNSGTASFQLAPDGRIYIGTQSIGINPIGVDSLGIIRYPNRAGAACGYVPNGLFMGPRIPTAGGTSLRRVSGPVPYFISSYLYLADFTTAPVCVGDSARFRLRYSSRLDSVRWRFQDPALPGGGTSTARPGAAHRYARPGTYRARVQVYYNDGATDTLSRLVTVRPAPTVALPAPPLLCPGQPLLLTPQLSPDVTAYRWSTGATTPTLTVTQPGAYSLTVTNGAGGCAATATVLVRAAPLPPDPLPGLPPDTLRCLDQPLTLRAPAGLAVRWPDGSSAPTYAVPPGTPAVPVQLTTAQGCRLTRTVRVQEQECAGQLVLPNIITPNDDGKNDGLQIPGLQPGVWTLRVFSRWGRLVYEQAGYRSGEWTAQGLPDGLYYYLLARPGQPPRKGWMEVMR